MSHQIATPPPLHPVERFDFASDNHAGVHPQVLAAVQAANGGSAGGYGEDEYTQAWERRARELFGSDARAVPVLNGTGANVLALSAITPRWGAVLVPTHAHTDADEGGAPERAAGLKLIDVPADGGKLTSAHVHAAAPDLTDQHHPQAVTVSIANANESGLVYTPEETRALAEAAHEHGMRLHVDGSRLANAAAALGTSLASLTSDAGVDAVSLGATKIGAMLAESVVTFSAPDDAAVRLLRKGTLQLASKQRFVAAQLLALYGPDELWRQNAGHANAMAQLLRDTLAAEDGVAEAVPTQSNAVFGLLDPEAADRVRERVFFHGAGTVASPARWMCSFQTTQEQVEALAAAIREEREARTPR